MVKNNQIDIKAWVIDPRYKWETKVFLHNFGDKTFKVDIYGKLARLIVEKAEQIDIEEILEFGTNNTNDKHIQMIVELEHETNTVMPIASELITVR